METALRLLNRSQVRLEYNAVVTNILLFYIASIWTFRLFQPLRMVQ